MAFTVEGEYNRLLKIKAEREQKSKDKRLAFECGCACGYVTRIEYQPFGYDKELCERVDEAVLVYAIAGWDKEEKLVLHITEDDVNKAYNRRKYKYWKEFGILESFCR